MPRKTPGYHGIHVLIREDLWQTLRTWAESGPRRIPSSTIINVLTEQFVIRHAAAADKNDFDQINQSIATAVGDSIKIIEEKRSQD